MNKSDSGHETQMNLVLLLPKISVFPQGKKKMKGAFIEGKLHGSLHGKSHGKPQSDTWVMCGLCQCIFQKSNS